MDDLGVIALDPLRLSGLEVYLEGLGDGCIRGEGSIADAVAGTGESATTEQAALRELAGWCRRQRDDVVYRRRMIEALSDDLPWPDLVFANRRDETRSADALGVQMRSVLGADPPPWPAVERLLREVARGVHSSDFAVRLLTTLGPDLARELPVIVEEAFAGRVDREEPGAEADLDRAHETVRDLVVSGLRVDGDRGVTDRWAREFAGLGEVDDEDGGLDIDPTVRRAVEEAGFAAPIALYLGAAYRAGRLGVTRLRGSSVVGVVTTALDIRAAMADPTTVNVLDASSSILGLAAPLTGPAAPAVYMAAAVLAFVAWAESHKQDDDESDVRAYNSDTGATTYPSGSATNPDVDAAGVPLPPGYA